MIVNEREKRPQPCGRRMSGTDVSGWGTLSPGDTLIHNTQQTTHRAQSATDSTQFTMHSMQSTTHSKHHTARIPLQTAHNSQCTVFNPQHTAKQHTANNPLQTAHNSRRTVYSQQHSMQNTAHAQHNGGQPESVFWFNDDCKRHQQQISRCSWLSSPTRLEFPIGTIQ